jgi:hypothetical protein
MPFVPDVHWRSLPKRGEELCGDKVEVVCTPNSSIVVLSDGLGSGVKANILATLTTKIASGMLKRGIPLEAVVETIMQTLPVCKVRKIAYSTLVILQVDCQGNARLVEIDSPPIQVIRSGVIRSISFEYRNIHGKEVRDSHFKLNDEDVLIMVSDGVVHAGIGGILKGGWGIDGLAEYAKEFVNASMHTSEIVDRILARCEGYYLSSPGDDTTVVAVKLREKQKVTLLTGPPSDPGFDQSVVDCFLRKPDIKVVAGGTTAKIVARFLGEQIRVELTYDEPDIPPTGQIKGIHLVTEGMLTLTKALEKLQRVKHSRELPKKQDGATRLAKTLLDCDELHIMAGTAVNPAHHYPDLPYQLGRKSHIVEKIAATLLEAGKKVTIEWC